GGRLTSYVWGAGGRAVRITTPDGVATTLAYGSAMVMSSVASVDALGRRNTLVWGLPLGTLSAIVAPDGSRNTFTSGTDWQALRDGLGNRTTMTSDGSGNLKAVVGATGKRVSFTWSSGRIRSVQDPLGRRVTMTQTTLGNRMQALSSVALPE